MNLSKTTSYVLIEILNGCETATEIGTKLETVDIRSIQRALLRLTELELITKAGSANNPSYSSNYAKILGLGVADKLLEDDRRPASNFRHAFLIWLDGLSDAELTVLFNDGEAKLKQSQLNNKMTMKELEHLTVELSWKSSSLEGNTYTLLDTELLIVEGIKAKNRTEFETQMILNHKNAVAFILENPELFTSKIAFSSVEELHRIIGRNLGIDAGIRKRLVRIGASNYEPLANPQQLKEAMELILRVISGAKNPFVRALLALSLVPYLQAFEDGNKRTGRMLANAILISSINRGFSLRKTDARPLALAYLSFYEFGSMKALSNILTTELT